MTMTYPQWRKLPPDLRGQIADCDACRFTRRNIRLCVPHHVHVADGEPCYHASYYIPVPDRAWSNEPR